MCRFKAAAARKAGYATTPGNLTTGLSAKRSGKRDHLPQVSNCVSNDVRLIHYLTTLGARPGTAHGDQRINTAQPLSPDAGHPHSRRCCEPPRQSRFSAAKRLLPDITRMPQLEAVKDMSALLSARPEGAA
jgi:hypothetical protein